MKTILVLGGYGETGRCISRRLLESTDARLVVAGRNPKMANRFAAELNGVFPGERVTAAAADGADPESLRVGFRGNDMVVVCLPTIRPTEQITRAALAEGLDYLDIHFPAGVVPILQRLEPDIRRAGRCFITQAGIHPGLQAPLVKFAAPYFSSYHSAAVAAALNFRYDSSVEAAAQFMDEIGNCQSRIFAARHWRQTGWRDFRKFDFGPGFGVRTCAPVEFAEIHSLPELYGLRQAGCYVSGFNWFTDNLLFPLAMLLAKVRRGLGRRWLGRGLIWATRTFSHPPFGAVLRLEAEGEKEGCPVSVSVELRHADVYDFTALAVVACLRQYLDGSITCPGLWLMGEAVEPVRLFQDMEEMGVRIETAATAPAQRNIRQATA